MRIADTQFRADLEGLLNKHGMESSSDTPDYALATFLSRCLEAYNEALQMRETAAGRTLIKDQVKTTDSGRTEERRGREYEST